MISSQICRTSKESLGQILAQSVGSGEPSWPFPSYRSSPWPSIHRIVITSNVKGMGISVAPRFLGDV